MERWFDHKPTHDTNVTASLAVTATFAANVLVFTTQPANLVQGGQLGTIAVAVQDGSGNVAGQRYGRLRSPPAAAASTSAARRSATAWRR
jgi:hypothetical protein